MQRNATLFATENVASPLHPKERERPPPSGTDESEIRRWCVTRGLPVDHPLLPLFLDEQRNCKIAKLDWPGAWRVFLARPENANGRRNGGPATGLGPVKRRSLTPEEIDHEISLAHEILGAGKAAQ